MTTNKLKLSTIALAVASSFAVDTAIAQESSTDDQLVETIEIRGIRASTKASINNKRFADSIVDSISAEDIGKFPDKNVAESLSRITGVAVSREFGEGEKISIRGAGPDLNRTLLNGQTVASADWFILDPSNRSFNYTLLPSSIVKGLEVYKSPQASIDEGSIGGTVVLRTRKPLELDANTINVGIQAQYSETSEETDPQLDALYSWKNEDETFGVLVNVISQDRTVQRQGFEVLGYSKVTPTAEDTDRADLIGNTYNVPTLIGVPRFDQSRERETVFASIQYAPTEELDFTLNYLTSEMDANNRNQNLLIGPGDVGNVIETIENGTIVGDNNVVASSSSGRMPYNFINRVSRTETESIDLDVNYSTDDFIVHVQVGSTEANGGTLRETSWEYAPAGGTEWSYDLSGTPTIETSVDPSDASQFAAGWIWGGKRPTHDAEDYAQLDLEIPIEYGPFTALKTGVKIRQAENSITDRQVYSWQWGETTREGLTGSQGQDIAGYMWWIFDQCPTLADCNLSSGSQSVDAVVNGSFTNQITQNQQAMESIAFDSLNGEPAGYAAHLSLADIYKIEEDITALYIQGDFKGDSYRGNVGLRYVSTKQTSGGYEFSQDSSGLLTLNYDWLTPSELEWVEVNNDYNEFLPSANIAFDLTEDQILRVGAARVMARHNWTEIASTEYFGDLAGGASTGTRGNPYLKPMIANQFDISYEWYYGEASMFSATYFNKTISSMRTSNVVTELRSNDRYKDVPVAFNQPVNDLGGTINGIELSIQHDFGGFGMQANYTYTDAKSDQTRDENSPGSGLFEGTSKNMLNLTGYYENDTFGARLMYNYRSDWYNGISANGAELWTEGFGQWDASASYNVTENIALTLEAVNLLDEEIRQYNTDKDRLYSLYKNGRRFVVGARFAF